MLWTLIERVVHLTTLVLLIVMLSIIFTNNKSSQDYTDFENQLANYKKENQETRSNNIAYIERRHNKLQEQQDNYQILVDRRLLNMEAQVKLLTDSTKINQKVIQNNINTNTFGNIAAH